MSYVIDALEEFEEFIENPLLFYAIIDLLPYSTQYYLLLQFYQYANQLEKGELNSGKFNNASIYINDKYEVILELEGSQITLCTLPPTYEI